MHKKICIVGDPHIDNKQPGSRLDNYMEASLADLKCTLMIAEENKCDAIVFLGDMFVILNDINLTWHCSKL
jgi:DNA repair exonuclease SbcCD nuclease subunit